MRLSTQPVGYQPMMRSQIISPQRQLWRSPPPQSSGKKYTSQDVPENIKSKFPTTQGNLKQSVSQIAFQSPIMSRTQTMSFYNPIQSSFIMTPTQVPQKNIRTPLNFPQQSFQPKPQQKPQKFVQQPVQDGQSESSRPSQSSGVPMSYIGEYKKQSQPQQQQQKQMGRPKQLGQIRGSFQSLRPMGVNYMPKSQLVRPQLVPVGSPIQMNTMMNFRRK